MKTKSAYCSLVLGLGLALSTVSSHADPGFYFTVDGGLNLIADFYNDGAGTRLEADPGVRFDAGIGYTFIENNQVTVNAGVETGFIYNSLDKGVSPLGTVKMEGDLWQAPILGKVVVKFLQTSSWTPYIGVGGGMVYASLKISDIGGIPVSVSGDEWDPAVQAMAGVKYNLNDKSSVGLGYKALWVFPEDGFEEVLNHSIVALFALHF